MSVSPYVERREVIQPALFIVHGHSSQGLHTTCDKHYIPAIIRARDSAGITEINTVSN